MGIQRTKVVRKVGEVVMVFVPLFADIVMRSFYKPYKRGFFCNDNSLMYPYKSDTVSPLALFLLCFCFTTGLFILTEVTKVFIVKTWRSVSCKSRTKLVVVRISYHMKRLLFAFGAVWLLTDFTKYTVGRLRPHFFDVCGFDPSGPNCTIGYIQNYACSSKFPRRLAESRFSFPSGHASISTTSMFYAIFYIQDQWRCRGVEFVRALAQVSSLMIMLLCSMTRVMDNKHHLTDVLAGCGLGVFVGAFVFFGLAKNSRPHRESRYALPGRSDISEMPSSGIHGKDLVLNARNRRNDVSD